MIANLYLSISCVPTHWTCFKRITFQEHLLKVVVGSGQSFFTTKLQDLVAFFTFQERIYVGNRKVEETILIKRLLVNCTWAKARQKSPTVEFTLQHLEIQNQSRINPGCGSSGDVGAILVFRGQIIDLSDELDQCSWSLSRRRKRKHRPKVVWRETKCKVRYFQRSI